MALYDEIVDNNFHFLPPKIFRFFDLMAETTLAIQLDGCIKALGCKKGVHGFSCPMYTAIPQLIRMAVLNEILRGRKAL